MGAFLTDDVGIIFLRDLRPEALVTENLGLKKEKVILVFCFLVCQNADLYLTRGRWDAISDDRCN